MFEKTENNPIVLMIYLKQLLKKFHPSIFQIQQVNFIQNISMSKTNGTIRIGSFIVQLNQVLGKGATSIVYKGYHSETFQSVAVKAIEMSQVNNQVTKYLLDAEKKAMLTIKSPYVMKTLDVIQEKDYCYLIMELCPNGTLKDYIRNKGSLNCQEAIELFQKIVLGYIAIVEANFIHRDLKTANILMRENRDPVISDFGYCQMIHGTRPTIKYNVGSPAYMSPQVHSNSRYSQKSDIWSLGTILYEMVKGKTLDYGKDIKEYFRQVEKEGEVKIDKQGLSKLCLQLLDNSLKVNYDSRVTAYKLKYFIDRHHHFDNKNLPKSQTSFGQPTHLNSIPISKHISIEDRQKFNSSVKSLKQIGSLKKLDHYGSSRQINHLNLNQNSNNSVQSRMMSSKIPIPVPITQNMPPQHCLVTFRSVQKNHSLKQPIRNPPIDINNIIYTGKPIHAIGQTYIGIGNHTRYGSTQRIM